MKATWAFWRGQPMYLMMRRWEGHGLTRHGVEMQIEKSAHQSAVFMQRWRVIPL